MDEVTEESVGVASYEAGKREMQQQELNGWHGLGVIAFLLIVILICSSSYTIYIYNIHRKRYKPSFCLRNIKKITATIFTGL